MRQEGAEVQEKLDNLHTQHDLAILRKAKAALEHKDQVAKVWACHEELLEAEVRLIEAKSDVAALSERNAGIVQSLDAERQIMKEVEVDSKRVKETARKALEVCQEISAEAEADGNMEYFRTVSHDLTVQDVEADIASEESKLEYIHASNPNAIRDFEKRQVEVEKFNEKIAEAGEKLERFGRQITKIRHSWEPELDKLIEEISDAFSYNFEQIGCAGEVGIHKDEDFDNWAVQIKVKFRSDKIIPLLRAKHFADNPAERTKRSKYSTNIASRAASAPSQRSSISWPCNPWRARLFASSTRSTKAWIPATSAWSTNAWSKSRARSIRASTSSSRRNC